MKVRNNKIICFDLNQKIAHVCITPSKIVIIDEKSLLGKRYMKQWDGFVLLIRQENGYRDYPLSIKVAKHLSKYTEPDGQDHHYDYFRFTFDKFVQ